MSLFKTIGTVALVTLIFGCSNPMTMDRRGETVRFSRTPNGFEYVVTHDLGFPEGDSDAEKNA
jgi:hypothetical protein